jgi:hypothetical protein
MAHIQLEMLQKLFIEKMQGPIGNSQIQVGDVVKLKTAYKRKTYKNKGLTGANNTAVDKTHFRVVPRAILNYDWVTKYQSLFFGRSMIL